MSRRPEAIPPAPQTPGRPAPAQAPRVPPAPATGMQVRAPAVPPPAAPVGELARGLELELGGSRVRILEPLSLGEGGQADLYLVERAGSREALKVYRDAADPALAPKREVLERLSALEAPGVLRLRAFGLGPEALGERHYEIWEYAQGGDLLKVPDLRAKYTVPFVRKDLVPQLLAGLSALHRVAVFHGDLKPSNVLYLDEAQTRLAIGDFGSAYAGDQEVRLGVHVTQQALGGTPLYMAPERRAQAVGAPGDFYGMGMLLIHLLYPEQIADQDAERRILQRLHCGQPPVNFTASLAPLDDLLVGLTLQAVDARWGQEEVERWHRGEPVQVRRPHRPGIFIHAGLRLEEARDIVGYAERDPAWHKLLVGDGRRGRPVLAWVGETLGEHHVHALGDLLDASRGDVERDRWTLVRYLTPEQPIVIDGTPHELWTCPDPEAAVRQAIEQLEAAYPATDVKRLRFWAFQLDVTLLRRAGPDQQTAEAARRARGLIGAFLEHLDRWERERRSILGKVVPEASSQALERLLGEGRRWPDVARTVQAELARRTVVERNRRRDRARSDLLTATAAGEVRAILRRAHDLPEVAAEARARLARLRRAWMWSVLPRAAAVSCLLGLILGAVWWARSHPRPAPAAAARPLPAPAVPAPRPLPRPPETPPGPGPGPVPEGPGTSPGDSLEELHRRFTPPPRPVADRRSGGASISGNPAGEASAGQAEPVAELHRPFSRPVASGGAAPAPASSPRPGAPLSCATPEGQVQRAICDDPGLRASDAAVAERYRLVRRDLPEGEAEVLRDGHVAWLARRELCGREDDVKACVERMNAERLSRLGRWLDPRGGNGD